MLPKRIRIKVYAIELEDDKQPPYGPIYSLGPIELKTLKTYIKINLANNFIRPFKSPAGTLVLYVCKLHSSLWLCINY